MPIEKMLYGEDTSPEIINLIKERVRVVEGNIILLKEIPRVSPFSIQIVFKEMTNLALKQDECAYMIDISDTEIPNAETRRVINQQFKDTLSNVKHVAFVTGKNFIINTAARFVMYQTNLNSFSINKSREDALVQIRKDLKAL